jgi:SPP1 family predicted phage head-tail adaptor
MPIGDLNKRIEIQSFTRVGDGHGGFTDTWRTEATVWAAIWPMSATEQVRSEKPLGTVSHRIRIRYRRNLRADWRIKFGNRKFNIVGPPINPNEKNEFLDLMCMEAM